MSVTCDDGGYKSFQILGDWPFDSLLKTPRGATKSFHRAGVVSDRHSSTIHLTGRRRELQSEANPSPKIREQAAIRA
jgi:hypothetical protein